MNTLPSSVRDSPIRVVVADDHPIIRGMVRSALEQHPHFEVCGEAENGAEAIEEVRRVKPDVVVLNITMPLLNGFEAARDQKAGAGNCDCYFVVACRQTFHCGSQKDWGAGLRPEIKDR